MKLEDINLKINNHLLEAWNFQNEYDIDCVKMYLKKLNKEFEKQLETAYKDGSDDEQYRSGFFDINKYNAK